jgi:hypothetical protein
VRNPAWRAAAGRRQDSWRAALARRRVLQADELDEFSEGDLEHGGRVVQGEVQVAEDTMHRLIASEGVPHADD